MSEQRTGSAGGGIQQLVERALALSTADDCIVIAEERTEANLRWAANSLTTNGQMHTTKLMVISILRGADGASVGTVSGPVSVAGADTELTALVRAAEDAARAAGPADDAADDAAELVPPYEPNGDWDAPAAVTGIDVFADFAPALGAAFARARRDGVLLFGFAEHVMSSIFMASSTGLRLRHDQPTGRLEVNGKSADLTRSAWVGQATRDFTDVDVAAVTADLDRRLEWARNRVELPAGRYETLLPPTAVADLMIYLYWTASARDADEGRSVFSARGGGNRIGTRITEQPLTLYSDPAAPGLQCLPFQVTPVSQDESVFDNGTPAERTDWIRDGELANLYRSRSWARRTGAEHRQMIDNLLLVSSQGSKSLDEMIAGTRRGLLVTCLWYIRVVDPQTLLLTGLTRDGVYLIEDGEVRGVVNNFRFNESPLDLLARVSEAGATAPTLPREWSDDFTRAAMPVLRIPDFNMSTVSQAS
ncbi:MAG TPA: metallopeptidase TldD-related protein [Jatrophihabitans sp.]|nr:metallopeptidase TldD-related protein [Jatrophihabitans sp.]